MLALLERFGLPVWTLPLAGFVLGSLGTGYLAWELHSGAMAKRDLAAQVAVADALRKKAITDEINNSYATALDKAHAERTAMDKTASDLARDNARLNGLWVKASRRKCVSGEATAPGGAPEGLEDVRLPDAIVGNLLKVGDDANTLRDDAITCFAWAKQNGRP